MPDIYVGEDSSNDLPTKVKLPDPTEKESESLIKVAKKELNLEKDKSQRHNHVLAAYCEHPTEIKYSNFLDNEEALLFLRRHFITNLPWIVKAIIFAIIPMVLSIFVSIFDLTLFSFLPYSYLFLGLVFYYFVVLGYVFVNYITWFYNISLVTTQRIVDIDFSHVIFENVSASKLGQIEDVHYSQVGVMASMFDYGDITVQTAGTQIIGFDFSAVPHPEKIIHFINSLISDGSLKNG